MTDRKAACPRPSFFCSGGDFHGVAVIVEFERQLPHPNIEKRDVRMRHAARCVITRLTTSHNVKYGGEVHIVTRRHLSEAMEQYPDAAGEIKAWVGIVEAVRWHNFAEVRSRFKDADYVDGYVIFNLRQNRYRLITVIHYAKTTQETQTDGHVYIRSFLTHKEYDNPGNWDKRFGAK
jgi:mRNA interferase HigB